MNLYYILYSSFWYPTSISQIEIEGSDSKKYLYMIGTQFVAHASWVYTLRPILSTYAHAFHCISPKHYDVCWKIDFISIVLYIGVNTVAFAFLANYCESFQVIVTTMFAWLLYTIASVYISWTATDMAYKDAIIGVFFVLGPLFHGVLLAVLLATGTNQYWVKFPPTVLSFWFGSIGLLIVGVIIRAMEFPEKWINQKIVLNAKIEQDVKDSNVNYICNSHQLWHIFINVACIIFFYAFIETGRYRSRGCSFYIDN